MIILKKKIYIEVSNIFLKWKIRLIMKRHLTKPNIVWLKNVI